MRTKLLTCGITLIAAAMLILGSHTAARAETVDPDVPADQNVPGDLEFDSTWPLVDATSNGVALNAAEVLPEAISDAELQQIGTTSRVWTVDAYGWTRNQFRRGERMIVWVEIANNSRYRRSAHVTLVNQRAGYCLLALGIPCPPLHRQTLYSGRVTVNPGLNRFYLQGNVSYSAQPSERQIFAAVDGVVGREHYVEFLP